jgi:hypothetical protein
VELLFRRTVSCERQAQQPVEDQFPATNKCATLCVMPILEEPLPRLEAATLRNAVLAFRINQRKRVFPTSVHVGELDGRVASFVLHDGHGTGQRATRSRCRSSEIDTVDGAQRTDIVATLIERYAGVARAREPVLWLTRPGEVGHPHDVDAAWLAAGVQAFAEAALPLTMVVVTRQGWYDPRSGVARRWRRLRRRSSG